MPDPFNDSLALFSLPPLPNYHIRLPMSTLHSKSVITRAAFSLVRPERTSFLISPRAPIFFSLAAHVAPQRRERTGWDFSYFIPFPVLSFYFYFYTYADARTPLDTPHTRERSRSCSLTESPEQLAGGTSFSPFSELLSNSSTRGSYDFKKKRKKSEKQKKLKKQSQVLHSP